MVFQRKLLTRETEIEQSQLIDEKVPTLPWPAWFSGLGVIPQSKRSPVQFLVRAHAWVAGSVPWKRQPINVSLSHQCFSPSLSPSLTLSLKINFKKGSAFPFCTPNKKQLSLETGYESDSDIITRRKRQFFTQGSIAFINWETNSLRTFNSSENRRCKHHYLFACACSIYCNS